MGQAGNIARAFVDARNNAGKVTDYPGDMPQTLADAYAIQEQAIALNGGIIAGWKVGRINAPLDAHYGANRLVGPIFANRVAVEAPNLAMPVLAQGFAAAEAEYLLRIGTLPPAGKTQFSMDEAADLIDVVHIGLEIASSPFPGINEHGPAVTISDFGNNFGLCVGQSIPDWRESDFLNWPITMKIEGVQVGHATAATMLDGPIGAARFLFELAAERGLPLATGQWISSGAVTGVHPVKVGDFAEAIFNEEYGVSCKIIAATPIGTE